MTRDRNTLLLAALYAAIAIVAIYTGYRVWIQHKAMAHLADTSLGQFQGPADARKVIVEFMDYRCHYCRNLHPTMQELLRRNPDLKIVYRHFPIYGRPSVIEADVALAAGMQGKFSEAHNALMSREKPITEPEIDALGRRLGLDMTKFHTDMRGPETGSMLLQTMDIVDALGIKGTPAFFVGDTYVALGDHLPTVDTFEKLLAREYGS